MQNEVNENEIKIELLTDDAFESQGIAEVDKVIFDLNDKIDLLSSHTDKVDCLLSLASGILCGMLDILWVGDFDLIHGRNISSDAIDEFVKKSASMLGCKQSQDVNSAVAFLEKRFPIPSDGNTPDFGGGLQHHLRDFAHHPTIVGLIFSILTQFTEKSYGTDVNGGFIAVDVVKKSKAFIGTSMTQKILFGTVSWFFHLVSDMAGSSATAGRMGGTGIPGPILSTAKELSALPLFKGLSVGDDKTFSVFLSKLFNGTQLAKYDESGKIVKDTAIRFDLRGELGVAAELSKQAVPVLANECIVRSFYLIRRLSAEIKENNISSIKDLNNIDWNKVKPVNNPTLTRMLAISTSVFTFLDIGAAVVTQKYWVSVNYAGVVRCAVAVGEDIHRALKLRNVKKVRKAYEEIKRQTWMKSDNDIFERIGSDMSTDVNMEKFGLTVEQTEILYNIEYYKTLNDINNKSVIVKKNIRKLKRSWLNEWKKFISDGFSSFIQVDGAQIHWYTEEDLLQKISECGPQKPWYRLVLLEVMLFEPYYSLTVETDKNGKAVDNRYKALQNIINSADKKNGDEYLDSVFTGVYCEKGYVKRLRKSYNKCMIALKDAKEWILTGVSIAAVITAIIVATAGAFAPAIATALIGSSFSGLSGAALTSACLAYLGGGAIAVGGAGMAGGTAVIVGGGAALGLGIGAGVGGAVSTVGIVKKKNIIIQSSKLLVSIREIFLNDEHDIEYSSSIYEQYCDDIVTIEKNLVDLRRLREDADDKKKKELTDEIKETEKAVKAMKSAKKSMKKFQSSFETGLQNEQKTV